MVFFSGSTYPCKLLLQLRIICHPRSPAASSGHLISPATPASFTVTSDCKEPFILNLPLNLVTFHPFSPFLCLKSFMLFPTSSHLNISCRFSTGFPESILCFYRFLPKPNDLDASVRRSSCSCAYSPSACHLSYSTLLSCPLLLASSPLPRLPFPSSDMT